MEQLLLINCLGVSCKKYVSKYLHTVLQFKVQAESTNSVASPYQHDDALPFILNHFWRDKVLQLEHFLDSMLFQDCPIDNKIKWPL